MLEQTQADLVDQLFNSSEMRLARILLLMAEFDKAGEPRVLIPKISQESLAQMVSYCSINLPQAARP